MKEMFRKMQEALLQGEDIVLAVIVESSGSTPRGAGACMAVTRRGRIAGTIGGGAVEYYGEQTAQKVLQEKTSRLAGFRLHENQVLDLGMICGGSVNVHFRYISAQDHSMLHFLQRIDAVFQNGEEAWLIHDLSQAGGIGVYTRQDGLFGLDMPTKAHDTLQTCGMWEGPNAHMLYSQKLIDAGKVYLFGGGHVSQALVPVLALVEFRCIVLEDREEFCRAELFQGVEQTKLIDAIRIADFVTIGPDDYIAIMTRGHKDDQRILAQALRTSACYIGMIGSARKTAGVFGRLREEGFTDQDIARVTTPIGLSIKAETPAEIAISIAAQMIQVRAQRKGNRS